MQPAQHPLAGHLHCKERSPRKVLPTEVACTPCVRLRKQECWAQLPATPPAASQYCTVIVGSRKLSSRVETKTLTPLWNDHFVFTPDDMEEAMQGGEPGGRRAGERQ